MLGMSDCKEDTEDGDNGEQTKKVNPLIGTWEYVDDSIPANIGTFKTYLVFIDSDIAQYELTHIINHYSTCGTHTFKYTQNGNNLNITVIEPAGDDRDYNTTYNGSKKIIFRSPKLGLVNYTKISDSVDIVNDIIKDYL